MTAARLNRVFNDIEAIADHLRRTVRSANPVGVVAQLRTALNLAESLLPREEVPTVKPIVATWLRSTGTLAHAFLGDSQTSVCGAVSRYKQMWTRRHDEKRCRHCMRMMFVRAA
jgi:hypothetical protein